MSRVPIRGTCSLHIYRFVVPLFECLINLLFLIVLFRWNNFRDETYLYPDLSLRLGLR